METRGLRSSWATILTKSDFIFTGEIEYAEPDYIGYNAGIEATVNDQHFYRQWSLHNDGSRSNALSTAVAGADIDMQNAWDIEQGSSDIIVAVIVNVLVIYLVL